VKRKRRRLEHPCRSDVCRRSVLPAQEEEQEPDLQQEADFLNQVQIES
jgi:hypothetical protein